MFLLKCRKYDCSFVPSCMLFKSVFFQPHVAVDLKKTTLCVLNYRHFLCLFTCMCAGGENCKFFELYICVCVFVFCLQNLLVFFHFSNKFLTLVQCLFSFILQLSIKLKKTIFLFETKHNECF